MTFTSPFRRAFAADLFGASVTSTTAGSLETTGGGPSSHSQHVPATSCFVRSWNRMTFSTSNLFDVQCAQPLGLQMWSGTSVDAFSRSFSRSAPGAPTYSWRKDGRSRARSVGAQSASLRSRALYVAWWRSAWWLRFFGRQRSLQSRMPPKVGCMVMDMTRVPCETTRLATTSDSIQPRPMPWKSGRTTTRCSR